MKGEEFEIALKKYGIPFHFSHSSYTHTEWLPYVASRWMEENIDTDIIDLWLELEEEYDDIWINRKNIDEILEEVIRIMQELDKKLDEKVWN